MQESRLPSLLTVITSKLSVVPPAGCSSNILIDILPFLLTSLLQWLYLWLCRSNQKFFRQWTSTHLAHMVVSDQSCLTHLTSFCCEFANAFFPLPSHPPFCHFQPCRCHLSIWARPQQRARSSRERFQEDSRGQSECAVVLVHASFVIHSIDSASDFLWSSSFDSQPKGFRPPFGNINNQAREILAQRGYTQIFLWDEDTGDSVGKSESYQQKQVQKMIDSYPSPHMLLSHEVFRTTTGTVLPEAIKGLQKAGYSLVTAGECTGTGSDSSDWYEEVGGKEERNDSWTC